MSSILTASSYSELQARLAVLPSVDGAVPLPASPPEAESPFGFTTHVHNTTHVLFDGYAPDAFNNVPLPEWLRIVGLSANDFRGHDPEGVWIGPFVMRLSPDGRYRRMYLFVVSVEVGDALADGVVDGATDVYTILTAVSADAPMPSLHVTWADGTSSCDERPTIANVSSAGPIKCVHDPSFNRELGYCSNPSADGICEASTTNQWASLPMSSGREPFIDGEGCVTLDAAEPLVTTHGVTAQFCKCSPRYLTRFTRPQTLSGTTLAVCSSHTCAAGDQSCTIRHSLQTTYEQFCGFQNTACDPGFVESMENGVPTCLACLPGTYEVENRVCLPAPSRFYAPAVASTIDDLILCPNQTRALRLISDIETGMIIAEEVTGNRDASMCRCEPGFYLAGVDGSRGCIACPEGAICMGASAPPMARRGFGELGRATSRRPVTSPASTTSTNTLSFLAPHEVNEFSFYQCRNFDACLEGGQSCDCIGGEIKLNESNQTEAAYILHTSLCGEGYKSDSSLCSHCDTPEYAKTQGRCERCIFNHFTYLILSALLVPTILYVIDLACNSFESIEIVRSCRTWTQPSPLPRADDSRPMCCAHAGLGLPPVPRRLLRLWSCLAS